MFNQPSSHLLAITHSGRACKMTYQPLPKPVVRFEVDCNRKNKDAHLSLEEALFSPCIRNITTASILIRLLQRYNFTNTMGLHYYIQKFLCFINGSFYTDSQI